MAKNEQCTTRVRPHHRETDLKTDQKILQNIRSIRTKVKKGKTTKGNQKPENKGEAVRATSVARGANQKSLPTAPHMTLGARGALPD